MNIEVILEEPQTYLGQSLEIEGYFIGLREGNDYIAYIGSEPDVPDARKQQIRIAHPFDELKAMIRPLPLMQLLYRGNLTNPPYYYRFPIRITARFEINGINKPVLQDISAISMYVPYTGKMAELTPYSDYEYSATIDYSPQREPESHKPAKAKISAKRILVFKEDEETAISISTDDNRYARRLISQNLKIGGWLKFLHGTKNGEPQLVLRTYAVRSSVISIGPLKEMSSIWLKPSPLYALLRAHMPISPDAELHQRVDIRGKIDYLQDGAAQFEGEAAPKLVFTEISAVTIYEEGYLLEA